MKLHNSVETTNDSLAIWLILIGEIYPLVAIIPTGTLARICIRPFSARLRGPDLIPREASRTGWCNIRASKLQPPNPNEVQHKINWRLVAKYPNSSITVTLDWLLSEQDLLEQVFICESEVPLCNSFSHDMFSSICAASLWSISACVLFSLLQSKGFSGLSSLDLDDFWESVTRDLLGFITSGEMMMAVM